MLDFGLSREHLALLGLASLALVAVVPLLGPFKALVSRCKDASLLSIAMSCLFTVVSIRAGGSKTNGQMRTMPIDFGVVCGAVSASGTAIRKPSVNLRSAPPSPRTEKWIQRWNARGAFDDSFRFEFEDGFAFPEGTNHLSGVEILASGEIWRSPFDTNPVASIGIPVSIVPGITTFGVEHTPSNTYLVSWINAAVNRSTNELITASIELFRNGDIGVTTNGVAALLPRVLPFPHDGFGQDDEWVAANFTNATEILAVGYPQWVDQQVGTGLTNGLYKLTAIIPDVPPETIQLVVGDYSVAVTNAGEYVFLLEKGIDYEYGVIPFLTSVSYSAVDDVPQMRGGAGEVRTLLGDAVRAWSVDGGYGNEPQTDSSLGRVWWMPFFFGSPGVSQHLGPGDGPLEFSANFVDYRAAISATYSWTASDGLTVHSPSAQMTLVSVDTMPSWAQAGISVTASVGGHNLTSTLENLTYGTNDTPQVHLSLSLPSVLIVRDEWMAGSRSAVVQVNFSCDIETNGILFTWLDCGANKVMAAFPAAHNIALESNTTLSYVVDGVVQSDSVADVRIGSAFVDESGMTNATAFATTTVVSPKRVSVPSAPETGLCVVKGATVSAALMVEPNVEVEARWQTAKRRTKVDYDSWVLRETGSQNASFAMLDAGVFALRAITIGGGGCQSNAVEYIHTTSELPLPALHENGVGPNVAGERNHIGVSSTQGLLSIRNAALGQLYSNTYSKELALPARNGFSAVSKSRWKCNAFVADMAIAAGFSVPVQHLVHHYWPLQDSCYPPTANEWANGTVPIAGWVYLGKGVCPEPGFIVGRPATDGPGHCGIVDYDGWVISARAHGVSRKAIKMFEQKCGYNKPLEDN